MYFRNMSCVFDHYDLKSCTTRKLYFTIKCELDFEIQQLQKTKKVDLVRMTVGCLVINYLIQVEYVWQLFKKKKSVTTVNNITVLSIRVLWDVTLCCSVSGSWHFKQMWCLHIQESRSPRSLKRKGPHSFKISRPLTEWQSITVIFLKNHNVANIFGGVGYSDSYKTWYHFIVIFCILPSHNKGVNLNNMV
jgi:hypothetical protein